MSDIVDRLRDPEQGLTSSDRFHLHKDAAAEIERLQAALRPFAALELADYVPDDALVIVTDAGGGIIDTGKNRMTAGDLRRARAALSGGKE